MYALFASWRCRFWHSRQFTSCRKVRSLKPGCYFKPSQNIDDCFCSLEQTVILHCDLVASRFQRLVWTRTSYRSIFVFRYQVGPAIVFCHCIRYHCEVTARVIQSRGVFAPMSVYFLCSSGPHRRVGRRIGTREKCAIQGMNTFTLWLHQHS